MSIQASELKLYGSAVMPDDDTATAIGGAINTAVKMEFTDITPSGTVEMLSSETGDTTQTVTIYGRDSTGTIVSEVKTLNGASVVSFTTTFERILKAVMSGAATGTVTIRKASAGATLITLEPDITQVRRPFYAVNTPESGSVTYYEKVFFKNTNGTITLSSGVIKEAADPSGKVTFGLPATIDVELGEYRLGDLFLQLFFERSRIDLGGLGLYGVLFYNEKKFYLFYPSVFPLKKHGERTVSVVTINFVTCAGLNKKRPGGFSARPRKQNNLPVNLPRSPQ